MTLAFELERTIEINSLLIKRQAIKNVDAERKILYSETFRRLLKQAAHLSEFEKERDRGENDFNKIFMLHAVPVLSSYGDFKRCSFEEE